MTWIGRTLGRQASPARPTPTALLHCAPSRQGTLVRAGAGALDAIYGLADLASPAAKLLHLGRSTPGVASVLVGHLSREHVEANTAVAHTQRMGPEAFEVVRAQVAAALAQQRGGGGGSERSVRSGGVTAHR
jgi:aryl-alcohol dehydrogenase-like predicted oxidoreductase